MNNKEIEEVWGEHLYRIFANHINEDGWLTADWPNIIESEVPIYDSDYNENPDYKGTYSRMYNLDYQDSEDGKFIRPVWAWLRENKI